MSYEPPRPSRAFRVMAGLARRTRALPASTAWALVVAILTASASLDVAIGDHVSPFLFYLVAVGVAAWRFGERLGLVAVGAVAVASVAADIARTDLFRLRAPAVPSAAVLWGEATHLLAALLLVLVVTGVRRSLEHERWRATVDPLTGALNRAAFFDGLTAALPGGRRHRAAPMLLAYADLDGFKALNDAHGHAAGDRLLRLFAEGAMATVAATDLVARTGGDEFALLAAVPADEDGEALARRIHRRLTAVLADARCGVTCSVGAVLVPKSGGADAAALIAAADALMYEAKRAGKDALRFAAPPPSDERPRLRLVCT